MFNFNAKPAEPEFKFRPVDHTDICFIHEVRDSARQYLHDNRYFSLQDVIEFVVIKKPKWLIIETDRAQHYSSPHGNRIGYFRTKQIDKGCLEIGADLLDKFRGKGWAKDAYRQFIAEFFANEENVQLSLSVLASNSRALNLYLTLGFRIMGRPQLIVRPLGSNPHKEVSLEMMLTRGWWNGQP